MSFPLCLPLSLNVSGLWTPKHLDFSTSELSLVPVASPFHLASFHPHTWYPASVQLTFIPLLFPTYLHLSRFYNPPAPCSHNISQCHLQTSQSMKITVWTHLSACLSPQQIKSTHKALTSPTRCQQLLPFLWQLEHCKLHSPTLKINSIQLDGFCFSFE